MFGLGKYVPQDYTLQNNQPSPLNFVKPTSNGFNYGLTGGIGNMNNSGSLGVMNYGAGTPSLGIGGDQSLTPSSGFDLTLGGLEQAGITPDIPESGGFTLGNVKTGADILSGLYGMYASRQTLKQNDRQIDLSERNLVNNEQAYADAKFRVDQSRGYIPREFASLSDYNKSKQT